MSEPHNQHSENTHGAPEAHGSNEHHGNSEATHASNNFLKEKALKLKRWIGHGLYTVGSELAINVGSLMIALGGVATVLGVPIPLGTAAGMTGLGMALSAGGVATEWIKGMKNGSSGEKKLFLGTKIAQTVGIPLATGIPAAAGFVGFAANPLYGPVADGLAIAGAAMGARAVSHRK